MPARQPSKTAEDDEDFMAKEQELDCLIGRTTPVWSCASGCKPLSYRGREPAQVLGGGTEDGIVTFIAQKVISDPQAI